MLQGLCTIYGKISQVLVEAELRAAMRAADFLTSKILVISFFS